VPIKTRNYFYELVEDHFKVFEDACKKINFKLNAFDPPMIDERKKQIVDKVQVVQDFMSALRTEIDT
jgi:hypothetical protein